MKRLLLAAAAALSLTGCSYLPGPFGDARVVAAPTAPSSETEAYLRAAGESDIYEITSSQLALQRTQNPDVRAYAAMLIDHHTGTTNLTLAAAQRGGVAPPPVVLGPARRALIDQLNAVAGSAFDRLYIAQQVPAHEEALALHGAYARTGDVPPLRKSAGAAVPVVTRHLEQARALQARLGGM